MILCKQCKKCEKCCKPYSPNSNYAEVCEDFEKKKMTNYEKIKQMSIDDMARFFDKIFDCHNCPNDTYSCGSNGNVCTKQIKEWLESEEN